MNTLTLHTNQRLLVDALIKKGASVRLLDAYEELIEVTYQGKKDFLLDRFSSKVPFHVVKMTADKHFAKSIFKENTILTPDGLVFTGNTIKQCLEYAQYIYPVVLKPNWGSHGDHVQVNIKNEQELQLCINQFIEQTSQNDAFIIEKYYPWKEYRLFITEKGGFAVVHRECASVIGDGKSTLKKLIEVENIYRKKLKESTPTSLCPIVIDKEVYRYLKEQNIEEKLDYIPKAGHQIFLRNESNLAKGGKAIDVTDTVHPSIHQLALNALLCFPHLPAAGLDLLCEDITSEINMVNYVIIEINSNPGLAMHTYPTEGISRNVTDLLLDVMFPQFFNDNTHHFKACKNK